MSENRTKSIKVFNKRKVSDDGSKLQKNKIMSVKNQKKDKEEKNCEQKLIILNLVLKLSIKSYIYFLKLYA